MQSSDPKGLDSFIEVIQDRTFDDFFIKKISSFYIFVSSFYFILVLFSCLHLVLHSHVARP